MKLKKVIEWINYGLSILLFTGIITHYIYMDISLVAHIMLFLLALAFLGLMILKTGTGWKHRNLVMRYAHLTLFTMFLLPSVTAVICISGTYGFIGDKYGNKKRYCRRKERCNGGDE